MNPYSVVVNKNNLTFDVHENTTGYIVAVSPILKSSQDTCTKLKNGAGFKGATPRFFCDPVLKLDK